MVEYFKQALRFFALFAAIPLIVGFAGAWADAFGLLVLSLGQLAALAILAIGAIIWMARGVMLPIPHATKIKRAVAISISPLLFTATIMLLPPAMSTGSFLGSLLRLGINYGHYETIIAKVQTSRSSAMFENDDGLKYSIDLGPPVRVAFNPEGLLDNWTGIIYDPTGDVMLAKGFNRKTGAVDTPNGVRGLFGGDLVDCIHLWRNYYRCTFT